MACSRGRYQGDGDFDATHFPLDIRTPDYDETLTPNPAPYSGGSKNSQIGFYLQDHVNLTDRLAVTLSGRWIARRHRQPRLCLYQGKNAQ